MPRVLEHLEPKAVFHFFEDLTRIPHGSRNTKAISDYCVSFAKERGLWVYQDELNNVIIKNSFHFLLSDIFNLREQLSQFDIQSIFILYAKITDWRI